MVSASLDEIIHKINLDLTGFLTEVGFSFVGRCNCDRCLQDKYQYNKWLMKICRTRGTFSLYRNNHLVEHNKMVQLTTTLQQYELIEII